MVNGKQRLNVCACANAVMACHEDVRTMLLDNNLRTTCLEALKWDELLVWLDVENNKFTVDTELAPKQTFLRPVTGYCNTGY